jgi:hypothetical protein
MRSRPLRIPPSLPLPPPPALRQSSYASVVNVLFASTDRMNQSIRAIDTHPADLRVKNFADDIRQGRDPCDDNDPCLILLGIQTFSSPSSSSYSSSFCDRARLALGLSSLSCIHFSLLEASPLLYSPLKCSEPSVSAFARVCGHQGITVFWAWNAAMDLQGTFCLACSFGTTSARLVPC